MRRARWADALARWAPGLLAVGCLLSGCPLPGPPAHQEEPEPAPEPSGRPPSWHPESCATHIPPTDVERELWSALSPEPLRTRT
ncbi:DUF6059 family protein [Streptomyces sp. NPDC021080]|uniref:DUF6059 family protein n=1 Tax=Streptomyces sp. NPDC021080 TaxID=3365110 RepID=UPI0037A3B33E